MKVAIMNPNPNSKLAEFLERIKSKAVVEDKAAPKVCPGCGNTGWRKIIREGKDYTRKCEGAYFNEQTNSLSCHGISDSDYKATMSDEELAEATKHNYRLDFWRLLSELGLDEEKACARVVAKYGKRLNFLSVDELKELTGSLNEALKKKKS